MTAGRLLFLSSALVLATILMALAQPASAASFDCTKAVSPLEKVICGNEELSRLDEQLAEKYRSGLNALSPEGQSLLRRGQRDWLALVRTHCASRLGQPADPIRDDATQCLRREYDARLQGLGTSAQRLGPYMFSRVDRFLLQPVSLGDDIGGSREGFTFAEISYPRIDAPANAATLGWNRYIAAMAEASKTDASDSGCGIDTGDDCSPDTDWGSGFELVSAQQDFISLSYYTWWYWHGAAHGSSRVYNINYLLATGKELSIDSLFVPGSGWKRFLAQLAVDQIKHDKPGVPLEKVDARETIDDFTWTWTLRNDALLIDIDLRYDIAYVFGSAELSVPWRDLKPYLRADLPISLKQE